MDIQFKELIKPTVEIVEYLNKWQNDPTLIPFIRPSKNQADLEKRLTMTIEDLELRLEYHHTYLMYLRDQLVGEMGYQVDHKVIYKEETGTAWIDIMIGEEIGRGKGIGYLALQYLERTIKERGFYRIELGVFEFNTSAINLYRKAGYQEIVRLPDFTYWQNQMWHDIRMEKYI